MPGLGDQFSAGAIAWRPELGRIGNKAANVLVGVAPYDEDSREHRGERRIKGGRREIRDLLYMATLAAASHHNPVLRTYYQRLRAEGRPKSPSSRALHKLIVILNTMLARGQVWNPPAAQPSHKRPRSGAVGAARRPHACQPARRAARVTPAATGGGDEQPEESVPNVGDIGSRVQALRRWGAAQPRGLRLCKRRPGVVTRLGW